MYGRPSCWQVSLLFASCLLTLSASRRAVRGMAVRLGTGVDGCHCVAYRP